MDAYRHHKPQRLDLMTHHTLKVVKSKLGFVIYIGPLNGASVVYPFLEPYLNQAEEAANALELDKKLAEQVKKKA